MLYMHMNMQLSIDQTLLDETAHNINELLEGTHPSDTYFCLHVFSWSLKGAALHINHCNLNPTWKILQQDQVQSIFKSMALDYLWQMLQVKPALYYCYLLLYNIANIHLTCIVHVYGLWKATPSDILKMIKTHSPSTGYDACFKIKPTLNILRCSFGLTSGDMRKLVWRMPSLLGMSKKSIDDKLNNFLQEGL